MPDTNNSHCLNCGQHLLGTHCHVCGQEDVDTSLRFRELVRDYLGDAFTYDSRVYRTMIPLLFRPGFLTLEFYRGRRVLYVPPLRLFLFISFLLFLWFASVDTGVVNIGTPPSVAEMSGELDVEEDLGLEAAGIVNERRQSLQKQIALVAQNPQGFFDLVTSRLPYLMFLMLPVLAAIFWLHYGLSGYNYLQHLIFALHFQSFAYMLAFLLTFAKVLVPANYGGFGILAVNLYLALALRRVFGSSIPGSILKTVSILTLYVIALSAGMAAFLYLNLVSYA